MNCAAFVAYLADHKFFDVVAFLFWFENHGKCRVDATLGAADRKWKSANIFSADTMMEPLQQLDSGTTMEGAESHKIEASILNPAAMDDWEV